MWEAPGKRQRTSVGLDVHARSVVGCGLDEDIGEVFERRLCPDHREVLERIRSLPAPVAVTYEAGPTGFGLARALSAAGLDCFWWRHRQNCSAQPAIGSKPTPARPRIWPGWAARIQEHFTKVTSYLDLIPDEGEMLTGGRGAGWSVRPTVVTDVDPGARLCREEIFGPVVVIVRFDTEAMAMANDSPYGLNAMVFTRTSTAPTGWLTASRPAPSW